MDSADTYSVTYTHDYRNFIANAISHILRYGDPKPDPNTLIYGDSYRYPNTHYYALCDSQRNGYSGQQRVRDC